MTIAQLEQARIPLENRKEFENRLFCDSDILMCPSTLDTAPLLGTATGNPMMSRAFNILGLPSRKINLLPAEPALRVKALETILIEKGLLDQEAVDAIIDEYEQRIGPHLGAKIVARAWNDPAFKSMLLADSEAVLREEGHAGRQGEHVVVVENTNKVHNLVVCTLCSCYPWPLLGSATSMVQIRCVSESSCL